MQVKNGKDLNGSLLQTLERLFVPFQASNAYLDEQEVLFYTPNGFLQVDLDGTSQELPPQKLNEKQPKIAIVEAGNPPFPRRYHFGLKNKPLKRGGNPNRNLLFQGSIFRCKLLVSEFQRR